VERVGRVAVLGEETAVAGYALAGAMTVYAEDAAAVRAAWAALPDDVDVVILTRRAADALGPARTASPDRLSVAMPS
jgi:vacuolar-type H+-ATPase subunit F/Vma7